MRTREPSGSISAALIIERIGERTIISSMIGALSLRLKVILLFELQCCYLVRQWFESKCNLLVCLRSFSDPAELELIVYLPR